MNRGGARGLAKGESLIRVAFRVTITTSGRLDESNAARTSGAESGDPTMVLRPLRGVRREGEFRSSALMVWPRERASSITS